MTIAINFLIVAGALFFVVKRINYWKRTEAAKPAEPPIRSAAGGIRDLLKPR